jgi:glutathione synthase/RimK-type ligase-like ATP-grasp enzyme
MLIEGLLVLFVQGIPDDKMVKYTPPGEITSSGSCNAYPYLSSSLFEKKLFLLDAEQSTTISISQRPHLLFNQTSDPDTHLVTLKKTKQLADFFACPIINAPHFILNTFRDRVYELLKDKKGIFVPKTIAIFPESPLAILSAITMHSLSFPIIIREAGSHNGQKTLLINSKEDLFQIYCLALDKRKYYLTEFFNFKNADGLYIKYRITVVGKEFFLRHAIPSLEWMIHAQQRTSYYAELEKNILETFESDIKPRIRKTVEMIADAIHLDFFGIDCSIDDEGILKIFEINANMNMLSKSKEDYLDLHLPAIQDCLIKLMMQKTNTRT